VLSPWRTNAVHLYQRILLWVVFFLQFWTELFVQWSPLGSYLATVHRQGAAIWGGPSWNRTRFAHPQVRARHAETARIVTVHTLYTVYTVYCV